jgi:hypothetical protein
MGEEMATIRPARGRRRNLVAAVLGLLAVVAGALVAAGAARDAVAGALAVGVHSGDRSRLVPHRATYVLSRGAGSRDQQIVSVAGRLQVSFEASCDGWRIVQAMGLRLFAEGGVAADSVSTLTAWETADGRDYWFNTLGYDQGRLSEVLAGRAHVALPEGPGRLRLSSPNREERELPAGTVFPVAHIEALLDAASDKARALSMVVFDGSTRDSPYEISAFFGAPKAPNPKAGSTAVRGWPVRLAYYRTGAVSPAPEFEMSLVLHDNGVAADMVYDYGDLEIDVALRDVEVLTRPTGCE